MRDDVETSFFDREASQSLALVTLHRNSELSSAAARRCKFRVWAAAILSGGLLLAATTHLQAQAVGMVPVEGDHVVERFKFQDGSEIDHLRLHYVTLGAPKRNDEGRITNAVLLLHQTGASADQFLTEENEKALFAAGQPLDAARYYLVIPDGIGEEKSSKPSDGLQAQFPHYGYIDQVEAQRALIVQGLGVDHLALVLGTSMGGMQAWLWAERHPTMMDATVAIAATPAAVTGRNKVWRDMVADAIRADPGFRGGSYASQPATWRSILPLVAIMIGNARWMQVEAPTTQTAESLVERIVRGGEKFDADDFLAVVESSWDYDPGPKLCAISAPLLALNFADDMLNPAELGMVEEGLRRFSTGSYVLVPAGLDTFGHETLEHPMIWRNALAEFMARVPRGGLPMRGVSKGEASALARSARRAADDIADHIGEASCP